MMACAWAGSMAEFLAGIVGTPNVKSICVSPECVLMSLHAYRCMQMVRTTSSASSQGRNAWRSGTLLLPQQSCRRTPAGVKPRRKTLRTVALPDPRSSTSPL